MNEIVVDTPMNNINLGDLTNQLLAQMNAQHMNAGGHLDDDFWEDVNEEEVPELELQGDHPVQFNWTSDANNTVGGDTF